LTNKRLLILEVKQVQSIAEIHESTNSLISEHPIDRIEPYSDVNEISGIAEMVINLSGEELRCSFGILISGRLYFGRNTISIKEYNAVVNAYANEIRQILTGKNGQSRIQARGDLD